MDLWRKCGTGTSAPQKQDSSPKAQPAQATAGSCPVGAEVWTRWWGPAKHISTPEPLTMLHAIRAQVFTIVRTEDLFLFLQKDLDAWAQTKALSSSRDVGHATSHPKETERQSYSLPQPEGQVLTFSQHPTPLLSMGRKTSASSP